MGSQITKIHPDLQGVVKWFPKVTFSRKNLWLVNFLMHLIPSPSLIDGIPVENILIKGENGQGRLRLRLYKSNCPTSPTPVLVWLHGGGYILGKPEIDDRTCAKFVQELGITVISVDYRLAPKHPFPAGLNDCYAALKWVAAHAEEYHFDPERMAVGGSSAGGGLAAALIQLAHDRQEIKPVLQLLLAPMLDDRTLLKRDIDESSSFFWNQKSNRFAWEAYLGGEYGLGELPAYSVPARRADLSGLPPAWIGVGELDLFFEENLAYAQRLKEAGIPCQLEVVPGAFHGFDIFDSKVQISKDFRNAQICALKRYLL